MAYNPHLNRTYSDFNVNDIMRWIAGEVNGAIELTEEMLERVADYAVTRLQDLSPRGNPRSKERRDLKRYAASWRVRAAKPKGYKVAVGTKFNVKHAVGRVVYNTQGRLTHILEYGTTDRKTKYTKTKMNRGRVDDSGLKHIEVAYMDAVGKLNEMIDNI